VTNFRRQILIKEFILFDSGILALSYLVTAVRIWHLTEFNSLASFISIRVKVLNTLVIVGIFYSWYVIFSAFGLYRSRQLGDRVKEASDVLKATLVAALVLGLVATIFRVQMIAPTFIVLFWAVSSLIPILCCLLMRTFLAWICADARNIRRVLIVGTNRRAEEFARTIDEAPTWATSL
jgi:FlaA1/EpsC-like NDP-sugar epimerase